MNERTIFLNALELADAAARDAYLDQACGGDAALRQSVAALLKSHEEASGFLRKPAVEQVVTSAFSADTPAEPLKPTDLIDGGSANVAAPASSAMTQPEHSRAGDDDLSFLDPATTAGSLGRLGHYEIQEVIGKGGFGIVLKGFDSRLHRVVAIKVLSPAYAANGSARKRFIREARAAAAVKNEHVVGIYDVQEDANPPYLVMECIDGISLQEKIDRHGPPGVIAILRIGMQIAEGLAAAHKQGKIHRDIKPANILLENGVERVKITDFGLARAVDDASVTQSGTIAGTPMYMSPEQAEGLSIDHRSDLFSLGTVLYAMCTGHPPFRASGTHAVLKRVIDASPRPIREINNEIPEWLCDIVARLHAKKPEGRFASATELAVLLGGRLADVQTGRANEPVGAPRPPSAAPAAPAPTPAQALWTRNRWIAGLGLAFIGVIICVTSVMLFNVPRERVSPPGVQWLIAGVGMAILLAAIFLGLSSRLWATITGTAVTFSLLGVFAALWFLGGTALVRLDSDMDDVEIVLASVEADGHSRLYVLSPAGIRVPAGRYRAEVHCRADQKVDGVWVVDGGEQRALPGDGAANRWDLDLKGGERVALAVHTSPRDREPGWVPLFNGTDLDGWKPHPDQPGDWRVENGILVGHVAKASHLFSRRGDYENFHLRVEAKISAKGDSGLFFRCEYGLNSEQGSPLGYEANISFLNEFNTGSLWGAGWPPVGPTESPIAPDTWFTQEVIAQGNRIVIKVNGKTTVDFVDTSDRYRRGHLALQAWAIGTVVYFRKIEIKELAQAVAIPETPAQVLPTLAGTWKGEFTQRIYGGKPVAKTYTAVAVNDWIAGSKWLRQRVHREDGGLLSLVSFDPDSKSFQDWSFHSQGLIFGPSVGRWDPATHSMTWTNLPEAGILLLTTWHFVDGDTVTWELLIRDKEGRTLFEMSARMKRTTENVVIDEATAAGPLPTEMTVLDRLVGDWQLSGVIKDAENPAGLKATWQSTARKILGGRVIAEQQTGPGGYKDAYVLSTFDTYGKAYGRWLFKADGTALEYGGNWDEKTQTMKWHWTAKDGSQSTDTWSWPSADRHDGQLVTKDAAGRMTLEIEATSLRQGETGTPSRK